MSKNRLIAFGCSNTYGKGLPDCWAKSPGADRRLMFGPTVSNFAWPSVLAKHMSLDCVNLGKPAVSNKWICNEVLNTNFVQTDIVVFLWTYFDRFCFFQDDGSSKRLMIRDIYNERMQNSVRKYTKEYYKKYHTITNAVYESCLNINYSKLHLDRLGVKNYHFTCSTDKNMNNIIHTSLKWNNVDLSDKLEYNRCLTDRALDDMHPGVESQKNIANKMHNFIKEQ